MTKSETYLRLSLFFPIDIEALDSGPGNFALLMDDLKLSLTFIESETFLGASDLD
jgi:hypothetical protein